MLKFGNKEFRNLQEQVLKNMRDIENLVASGMILDEFGIKVVGQEASIVDMPTVEAYKEAHEDWAYGDAYAIGTEEPYTLYILTRANETHAEDYWFDIGEFPAVGPQGPQGPQGEVGPQGQTGATGPAGQDGEDAGFGTVSATAHTLDPEEAATASVTVSGPDTAKNFYFEFGIPKGEDGSDITVDWGEIEGTLTDQTDLVNALQGKQNTLVSGTNIKTINNTSILGQGNIDIQSAVWGNITGTLSNQTDLQTALNAKANQNTTYTKTEVDTALNTKQDAIADLSTIRAGAAAGATAVQPAAIANMVTTTGAQTISGDKTLSGILNKNTNGYGVVMPSTTLYTQNKTIATTDLIKEIYQHYITFKANNNKTVISVKVLTQSNTPMTASEFFSFVNDELPDSTGNIVATGTIHITNLDHKYVGAIGKGSSSSAITVYPLVSTGGYDSVVSLNASDITSFVDVVDRVGAHGAGSSGSIITRQDIIDALGYIPSHVDANPSSTTGTLTGIGIDGVSYAIQGGGGTVTDVEVNGTSVVSGTVANIDLTAYVLAASLADVATTGSYNDLINKPVIPVVPTDVSAFNNDAGYITSSALSGYATESYVQGYHDSTKQDVISDLATIRSGAALGATAVQPAALSDYVTKAGGTSQNPEVITGVKSFTGGISVEYLETPDRVIAPTVETGELTPTGTNYSISLPNKSGTVALTSDIPSLTNYVTTNTDQGINGKKTFGGNVVFESDVDFEALPIIKYDSSDPNTSHGAIMFNDANTYDMLLEVGALTANRHIALPDKSGTVALTSDIPTVSYPVTDVEVNGSSVLSGTVAQITVPTNYVTTNTGQSITGAKTFNSKTYFNEVAEFTNIDLSPAVSSINVEFVNGSGFLDFINYSASSSQNYGRLTSGALTGTRTYTFPDKSGTIAMTSDIPSLTGYATESWVSQQGYAVAANLATVATTGDYDDLINKPTIPAAQVNSDWNASSGVAQILNKPTLAAVATSGSYTDLSNTPTIPDAVSGTNDGTNWTSLTIGSDTYGLASGSAPSNMVTTDTAQDIIGTKTIHGSLLFKRGNYASGQIESNGPSTSSGQPSLLIKSADNLYWDINAHIDLYSGKSGIPAQVVIYKNLIPLADNNGTGDLGSSTDKWTDLYLSGNLSDGTNSIAIANIASKTNSETWTFTLSDGTTTTKTIVLG